MNTKKALLSSRLRRFLIALLVVPALQLLSAALLPAYAGETALLAADNTLILTSSALVLLMTPGLAFFYGGFVQSRNVLNTMAMSFVMMGLATLVWVTFGFSLAFSDGGALQAVVGNPFSFALLENVPPVWDGLAIPGLTFALFQGMFAIITPALISGALVERISFKFWCVFSPIWLLLVYAPLAHMVWGGGFLGKDLDFAGGTVVHISSGVSALVLAGLVGSRRQWPNAVRCQSDSSGDGSALVWLVWFQRWKSVGGSRCRVAVYDNAHLSSRGLGGLVFDRDVEEWQTHRCWYGHRCCRWLGWCHPGGWVCHPRCGNGHWCHHVVVLLCLSSAQSETSI